MTASAGRDGARGGAVPHVRAAATAGLCEALAAVGAEPVRLLGRARLKPEDLAEPSSWLVLADYCDLLEQAADHCDSAMFGLKLGLARPLDVLGALGPLVASAPTVGVALQGIATHFGVLQEQTEVAVERRGASVRMRYQIRNGHILRRRQDAELSLGALIGCIRHGLGAHWHPREVHFEHARPDRIIRHEALLGAPVYFGQAGNAVLLSAEDWAAPMPNADPRLWMRLRAELDGRAAEPEARDFVGLVLEEIRESFAKGQSGAEGVARRLGLSVPALYRRLKTFGVEFSDLQRELRQDLALLHVGQAHLSLTEIALALGYSELSAFSRAFRAWTGVSPNLYRKRRLQGR